MNIDASQTKIGTKTTGSLARVGQSVGGSELVGEGYLPLARRDLDLLRKVSGRLIRDAFGHLDGVARLLIFGSWATRYRGESGRPPNNLDVLVVGSVATENLGAGSMSARATSGDIA